MKKLIFTIAHFLVVYSSLYTQEISITEINGISEEYIRKEYNHSYHIQNKKDTLFRTESYFLEYAELNKLPEIALSNTSEFETYLRVYFSPYFKKSSRDFEKIELLSILIFSDLNGNIKEIGIMYPKDVDMPITAIEQFENAILSSSLRLVFDKTHKAFVNSPWVGRDFMYNSNKIKEMAP